MTAGASARRGVLVVVAAITLFACVDVLSKMLGQRMPVAIVIWARFVLFVPIALALAWRPGRGIVWRSGQPWLQVLRSVMLPLQMGLFISAFAALPLADVHAVGSAAPLLVTAQAAVGQFRVELFRPETVRGDAALEVRHAHAVIKRPLGRVQCQITARAIQQLLALHGHVAQIVRRHPRAASAHCRRLGVHVAQRAVEIAAAAFLHQRHGIGGELGPIRSL